MPENEIDHRETVAHMLSEFARELAVLVLVFVPLDYLLKGERIDPYFWYKAAAVLMSSGMHTNRGDNLGEATKEMTQLVSHLDLLIAVSPMLAAGFLACGAGFLYIAWEKRARRRATEGESRAAESRKAAHA